METQRSIFDSFNGILDNVAVTFQKGIETTNNVLNNLAAYEIAKSQREAAKHINHTNAYLQPEQYNDVAYNPTSWGNPANDFNIDRNLLTFAVLGVGIFAIYKIVK